MMTAAILTATILTTAISMAAILATATFTTFTTATATATISMAAILATAIIMAAILATAISMAAIFTTAILTTAILMERYVERIIGEKVGGDIEAIITDIMGVIHRAPGIYFFSWIPGQYVAPARSHVAVRAAVALTRWYHGCAGSTGEK